MQQKVHWNATRCENMDESVVSLFWWNGPDHYNENTYNDITELIRIF
jgi:hypothetical protein